jgi:hypothetical protein
VGLRTGSSLGRAVRELSNGDLIAKSIGALIFVGLAFYILYLVRQHKRQTAQELGAGTIQSMTVSNEAGVLHLVPPGGDPPGNVQSRLSSFPSADDAYHYVYQKYDEALFSRLLIHLPDAAEPVEFLRDPKEDDGTNLARLRKLFDSESLVTEEPKLSTEIRV